MRKRYLFKEAEEVLKKDFVMAKIIKDHYPLEEYKGNEPFEDLVSSIISQQLSTKAADTIYSRVLEIVKVSPITPESILSTSDQILRECGISFSKISYIKGISEAVLKGKLDFEKFKDMEDEEVINTLVELKGVGRWTAEMFLMHSLGRMDIFSLGDLGLRTAVSKHYGVDRDDLKGIEEITFNWKPYRTVASRYLWKSLG